MAPPLCSSSVTVVALGSDGLTVQDMPPRTVTATGETQALADTLALRDGLLEAGWFAYLFGGARIDHVHGMTVTFTATQTIAGAE